MTICLRKPISTGFGPTPVQVQDVVRLTNTVCIGYLDAVGKVHLGMTSEEAITLTKGEKLVVIAES